MDTQSYFKKGLALSSFSVICNAIGPLLNKFALSHVPPIQTALWISVFTIGILLIIWRFYKFEISFALAKELKWISFLNSIGVLFLYLALHHLNPITFGFIGRLTTILSIVILKERIGRVELAFTAVALVSSFLVGFKDGNGLVNVLGISFGIAYTFIFATANLLVKRQRLGANVLSILFFNNLGTLVVVIFVALFSQQSFHVPTLNSFYFLVGSAVMGLLGLTTLFIGFKYLSFRLANLIRSTSPILIALVSWPFFPINFTATHASGAGLLIMSLLGLGFIEKGKTV